MNNRTRLPHRNASLPSEGRKRLIDRCRTRRIAHEAAELGISGVTASKPVNRSKRFGKFGLIDGSSAFLRQPLVIPGETVARIESMWREKWRPASQITFKLHPDGDTLGRPRRLAGTR